MEDFEGDRPPAGAARPNQKVTKAFKVAKPKQAQPGRSSKASRAGLSSRRRAVDVEARVQGEVTQLDATQRHPNGINSWAKFSVGEPRYCKGLEVLNPQMFSSVA